MRREEETPLYYGLDAHLDLGKELIIHHIESYKHEQKIKGNRDPVEHYKARIKEEDSMTEKLGRKGLSVSQQTALTQVHDLLGARVVVTFINDIYSLVETIRQSTDLEVVEIKDYVKNPKPNGYRSVHVIVQLPIPVERVCENLYAEIQIRTIAMDCWASLEHQLKYKKDSIQNVELVVEELSRCAAEIAATDLTLQTIQEMINGEGEHHAPTSR